ncbi:hypothetical protein DL96DRAFT_1682003, partial [Flagelloscypha sp. PMI_526]
MFLLPSLSSLSLALSTTYVSAKSLYYIDDTNSTAWSFNGVFYSYKEHMPYNGSYTICGDSGLKPNCSGSLTFRGSSVDIYGVAHESLDNVCVIDFNWPLGNSTYVMKNGFTNPYNVSYAHADGFNPEETSSVSFSVRSCWGTFDYAVVAVDDKMTPDSNSITAPAASGVTTLPTNKPPVGSIVGGLLGGAVVLTILITGIWIKCRRRRATSPEEVTAPKPAADSQAAYSHMISL